VEKILNKKQAIILQIISFVPMIYTLLNILPFSRNIISPKQIQSNNYLILIIIIVILSTLYVLYFCFEIFKYKKDKKQKDYIWIVILFIGFYYVLPLYWYFNVIKHFNKKDYFFVYRIKNDIQPKLNEKDNYFC
jgi:RsiW-degrading membrane proteinase PrsW (M82 family)